MWLSLSVCVCVCVCVWEKTSYLQMAILAWDASKVNDTDKNGNKCNCKGW